MTLVSIVIPTFNAGPEFEALLGGISAQKGPFEIEVVVVDSGSTDGTAELAERHGAAVYRIPKAEFDHGATRNRGISLTRGEYVALTVQDAVPLDGNWLSVMVENLEGDERVAGVCGRQIARPDSGPLTRVLTNSLVSSALERREQFAGGPEEYRKLPPRQRQRLAAFDNVSSCLRRSVWEELPLEKASFGEDIRWGKKVVEAGYKTVYDPRSAVIHSHERGALYDLRRYYVDQRLLLELFGLVRVPNLARLAPVIARVTVHLYRLLRRDEELRSRGRLQLAWLALKYAIPSQIGNYLGARSAKISRLSPRLHGFLSKGV